MNESNISTINWQDNALIVIICAVIAACVLFYLILSLVLGLKVSRQNRELSRVKNQPNPGFADPFLLRVYNAYTHNLKSGGVNKLNTRAMIDSMQPASWYWSHSVLTYLSAAVITIGLLGTFIGFFISIGGFTEIIGKGVSADPATLQNQLTKPLSGIELKFITSIVGLIAALFMGFFNYLYLRPVTEKFEIGLLSYLDNTVAPAFATDTNKTVENALKNIDENMVGNIRRFSDNVNKLSDSMEGSVDKLNNAVLTLQGTVGGLNGAIRGIADPLDNFVLKMKELYDISNQIDNQINTVKQITNVLADNVVNALSERLNTSADRIDIAAGNMAKSLNTSAASFADSIKMSLGQLQTMMGEMRTQLDTSSKTNVELKSAIINMTKANDSMEKSIVPLTNAWSGIKEAMRTAEANTRHLVDEGIRAIESSTEKAADYAIDVTSKKTLDLLRNGFAPFVAELKDSTSGLKEIIKKYNANLEGIVGQFTSANEKSAGVLADSYKDYKQALLFYEKQVDQFRSAINVISDYVGTLRGKQPE